MTRAELNEMKKRAVTRKEQAADLAVLMEEIKKLPYGQLKKVLTAPVLEVLKKYGYTD